MTDSQNAMCHAIIHTASTSAAAVGGGLAQLPGADNPPLVAIQVTMIVGLGKVFGMRLSEVAAKAIYATMLRTTDRKSVV